MTRSPLLVTCLVSLAVFYGSAFALNDRHQEVLGNPGHPLQTAIRDALLAGSVIPDVLDDFTPTFTLVLTYPSSHATVQLGNSLSTSSISHEPVYQFHPLLPTPPPCPYPPRNHSYTLVLTDPDAKSRKNPKWSEMCHWIVANVTTPEFRNGPFVLDMLGGAGRDDGPAISHPKVLESYLAPSPPNGTGYHRYVFVLLQGETEDAWNIQAPKKRKHWGYHKKRHGVRDWAADNGLRVVGANFFYAKHGEDKRD